MRNDRFSVKAAPVAARLLAGAGRRVPVQRRSRERLARILATAEAQIAEQGLEKLRMSDLARRAAVSIGSLYQYVPDKTALVRCLAERHNAEGLACTAAALNGVARPRELKRALVAVSAGFLDMYRRHPTLRAIWQATQADPVLQALDAADMAAHAALLRDVLLRLRPAADPDACAAVGAFAMLQIGATVRLAITRDDATAAALMALLARTLPADVTTLVDAAGEAADRSGGPCRTRRGTVAR